MIEVIYAGHLGNNLFNYALGRLIAEESGSALFCHSADNKSKWSEIEYRSKIVDRLPDHWQCFEDVPQRIEGFYIDRPQLRYVMGEKLGWHGHSLNLREVLRQAGDHRIVLHGYFQRTEYYMPFADRIRKWFQLRPLQTEVVPEKRDVIVHVRRSLDMRLLDRRLDVSVYQRALEQMEPARVFVCGLGIDNALRSAIASYDPTYLNLDAAQTLSLMTKFNRIVMANSTFSWWGAFLSEAEEILFPIPARGFMSPDRAEVDLRVPEPRYRYIENAPLDPWRFLKTVDFQIREGQNGFSVVLPSGASMRVVSEEVQQLLRWMHAEKDSFGFHELHQMGYGPTINLISTLKKLLELGLITSTDSEPDDPPVSELLTGGIPFGLG